VVLAASAFGLVRLHATGGYLTVRHALAPGVLLLLAAAHGIAWCMERAVIDGRRLGLGEGRIRPGPAVWAAAVVGLAAWPLFWWRTPNNSSFAPYRMAGAWVAERPETEGRVLDLTDWSLFFSGRSGYGFEGVVDAAAGPETRWVLMREAHLRGHGRSNEAARALVAGLDPVARFPQETAPGQLQVLVFDLGAAADVARGGSEGAVRR
jgi:hypothetical protein